MTVFGQRLFPVRAAVGRALQAYRAAHGGRPPRDIETVVAAVAAAEGRRIIVQEAQLPWRVFGRWCVHPDGTEIIEVAPGLPLREWTIAHELGHVLLNHADPAAAIVAASSSAGVEGRPLALAERSSCGEHLRQERQAERFAALLVRHLHHPDLL